MSNFRDTPENPFGADPYGEWPQPKRSRGPLIIGIVVAVLAVGGIGAFAWKDRQDNMPPRGEESPDEKFREAAAAFDSTSLGTKDEELAKIHKLFTDLGSGFRASDGLRLASHFDMERMIKEVERLGTMPKMSPREYRSFVNGARIGLSRSLSQNAHFYAYERFDLKRCKFDEAQNEALVYIRMWDSDNYGMKMRWWLKKSGDKWRVYDFEELSACMRASNLIAATLTSVGKDVGKLSRMQSTIVKLQSVAMAAAAEDFDQLSAALDQVSELEMIELPKEFQAMVWAFRGIDRMADGKNEETLEALQRAETLHSDMPLVPYLRALTLINLERYADAEKSAREYLKQLGADADGYWALGDALFGQEKVDEAADAYRSSLDDDPDYLDSLISLSIALPDGKKEEVGRRFGKMRRPAEHFVTVCEELAGLADLSSLKAVIEAYRNTGTDDPELAYYDAWVKYQSEQFDEAAAVVHPAIKRVEDEENRQYFIELYFDAMVGAGKAVEAYNAADDPESAMEYLAQQLLDLEENDQLSKLLEAHRKQNPASAIGDYYAGELASNLENWDEAVAAYRAAIKKSGGSDLAIDSRYGAVYAMFMSDRVQDAYREFKPTREVFEQLSNLLVINAEGEAAGGKHASQLEALIQEHKQDDPTDPQLPLVSADLSWLKRDYADLAKLIGSPAMIDDVFEDWQRVDNLVRSLIHLKRFDQAFKLGRRDYEYTDDPWYPVLIKAAQGDVDATEKWLKKCDDYGYLPEEYYDDELLGPILRSPAFERLRDTYPEPQPIEDDAPTG